MARVDMRQWSSRTMSMCGRSHEAHEHLFEQTHESHEDLFEQTHESHEDLFEQAYGARRRYAWT
jgi:hypothetical protein